MQKKKRRGEEMRDKIRIEDKKKRRRREEKKIIQNEEKRRLAMPNHIREKNNRRITDCVVTDYQSKI